MRGYSIAAALLLLGASPVFAGDTATQWILNNFAGVPTRTGGIGGLDPTGNSWSLTSPILIKDAEAQGGYYGIKIKPQGGGVPNRAAFVNFYVHDQGVNGRYAAGIFTDRDWAETVWPNTVFDTYFSNVTIKMHLPGWESYNTTNFDGIMFDGGRGSGRSFAEDLTISGGSGWADGCVDFKGAQFQAVRMTCEGDGVNTLKMYYAGVHYLVDSTINNSRWVTQDVELGGVQTDGGLLSTDDCTKLEIRLWNTTWNGSAILPRTKIACWTVGTPADVKITYLTTDPRTTGEMHPMFGAPVVADLKVVLPKSCTPAMKGTVYNNAGTPAVCPDTQ